MGELKDVMIRLSSNLKVHQVIDVIVVDIPEAYGVILSRDWSAKLNGYFETNWSHLWLPFKGQPNKIKVECERYMKPTVIDLNDPNKPVMFSNSILGNFYFDTFFGELEVEIPPYANSNEQSRLLHVSTSKCPKDFGRCILKVGGLPSFVIGSYAIATKSSSQELLRSLELGPDPLGFIGEACIPPPRSRL